jgi:hypothetical protein
MFRFQKRGWLHHVVFHDILGAAPSARASLRKLGSSYSVSMNTRASGKTPWIRAVASRPFMTGKRRSMKTKSGQKSTRFCTASLPSDASLISFENSVKSSRCIDRKCGLSSTTRMRSGRTVRMFSMLFIHVQKTESTASGQSVELMIFIGRDTYFSRRKPP